MDDRIEQILRRNARVEDDKAWETSWTRRGFIACVTYICAAVFMSIAGLGHAPSAACIPTGGYLLSTLSLPFLKTFWLRRCRPGR